MKKTIAKIMAAAMVLSTVVAPTALAAGSYVDGTTAKIDSLKIAGYDYIKDGKVVNETVPLILTSDEVTVLENATGSVYSFSTADYTLGTGDTSVTASVYTTNAGATTIDTDTAATSVTTTTKTTTVDQQTLGALLKNYQNGKVSTTSKVVTTGKYNAELTASDLSSWYWLERLSNGIVVPVFNPSYSTFDAWAANLLSGNTITGTTKLVYDDQVILDDVNASIVVKNTTVVTSDNEYWNAFVKLKGDNNRYTPIRVHVNLTSGSNPTYDIVNGFVIKTSTTNGFVAYSDIDSAWANNKLEVYDVNANDLALLKGEYAKGKNLMLDHAYVWATVNGYGDYTASINTYTTWTDALYDSLDDNFQEVDLGKVTDIRSRVFKDCKEKLVHAENVKFIRNGAFRKNKQLKKVILGTEASVKKINEKAFYDCKKLTTAKIGAKTIKQVGKNAFGGSTDKKSLRIKLKGNTSKYNKAVKLFKKSGVKKAKFAKI